MIEIIDNLKELQSVSPIWNELADRFKTPLLSYEWFAACAAMYQPNQLRVIVNRSNEGIDAIAPLVLVKNNGFKRLELLGSRFLYEPCGLLYKDEGALKELIRFIINLKIPITLIGLGVDSSEVTEFLKMNSKGCFVQSRKAFSSLVLFINTSWAQFESNLTSSQKSNLRRRRKNAEVQFGRVEVEEISPTPLTLNHYFKLFAQIEASSWKGRNGTAILCDKQMQLFLSQYCEEATKLGILKFFFLKFNNEYAAACMLLKSYNQLWSLKIAYDETYARFSPGNFLEYNVIRYAFEQGLDAYELLGQDEPWKYLWTKEKHQYISLRAYPFTLIGVLNLVIDTSVYIINKLFKRGK